MSSLILFSRCVSFLDYGEDEFSNRKGEFKSNNREKKRENIINYSKDKFYVVDISFGEDLVEFFNMLFLRYGKRDGIMI